MVNDVPPKDRDIAMVFQSYALYPHMSVYDNMAFGLKLRKTPKSEIDRRVKEAADILGLETLLDRKPKALSGGQRQRVAVGRAIVREPAVFLMEEPRSNLDAKLRVTARAEISKLHNRLGTTFIYVTHDQVEAMTMGERIGILAKGRLIQVGTPYEIYNNPINTYVAEFVGTPAINLFDGIIQESRMVIIKDVFEFELDQRILNRLNGFSGEVKIGIRSEDIEPAVEKGTEGRIYGIEDMGMGKIVTIKINDHLLRATVDAKYHFEIDTNVRFQMNTEKLHFFNKDSGENLI